MHVQKSKHEQIHWKFIHGNPPKSRTNQLPRTTNFCSISHDTGIANQDLEAAMEDKDTWREIVQSMISAVLKQ